MRVGDPQQAQQSALLLLGQTRRVRLPSPSAVSALKLDRFLGRLLGRSC